MSSTSSTSNTLSLTHIAYRLPKVPLPGAPEEEERTATPEKQFHDRVKPKYLLEPAEELGSTGRLFPERLGQPPEEYVKICLEIFETILVKRKSVPEEPEGKGEKRVIDKSESTRSSRISNLIKDAYLASQQLGLGNNTEANKPLEGSLRDKITEETQLKSVLHDLPLAHNKILQFFFKAMDNIPEGQYQLGSAYSRGSCCAVCFNKRKSLGLSSKSNSSEASRWLNLASRQGYVAAEVFLASCHNKDLGLARSIVTKTNLYEKAVIKAQDNKDAEALYILGKHFYHGEYITQNYERAFLLFSQSVATGSTRACSWLGTCFLFGQGCPLDNKNAFEILSKADKEDSRGHFYLAFCFELGLGCERDQARAFEMFKKIAIEGVYLEAMLALASCYEEGKGCEIDLEEAYQWCEKARSQDDMERIRKKLTKISDKPMVLPGVSVERPKKKSEGQYLTLPGVSLPKKKTEGQYWENPKPKYSSEAPGNSVTAVHMLDPNMFTLPPELFQRAEELDKKSAENELENKRAREELEKESALDEPASETLSKIREDDSQGNFYLARRYEKKKVRKELTPSKCVIS